MGKQTGQLNLKTTPEDELIIQKARENFSAATGKKETVSKTIRKGLEHLANTPPPSAKPELFYINRRAIRDVDTNIEQGRANLQNFFDEFLIVTSGLPISLNEIQGLFGTGRTNYGVCNKPALRELIIDKLIEGKSTSVGGLKLSEEMLRSLVILPDLENLHEAGDRIFDLPMVNYRDVFYWQVYEIKEDKINIITTEVERVKDGFRAFASTPLERQKLSKVRELCELLGKLIENQVFNPEKLNIKGLCYWDKESARFEPDQQYIKFGLQETLIFTH
jgi:hypothetical protein